MRAVVTRAKGVIEMTDLPAPGEPGPGEVIVRPQAVGICGSDFHFLVGELGPATARSSRGSRDTRWAATVESVGSDCTKGLSAGDALRCTR